VAQNSQNKKYNRYKECSFIHERPYPAIALLWDFYGLI